MKAYVNENDTARTWILIIAAVFSIIVLKCCGGDTWLDFPLFLIEWASMAVAATAAGHIVWLLVSRYSEKNRFYSIMPLTCGILTAASVIRAVIEYNNGGFLSGLGAAVIELLFTVPFAAATIFWGIAGIRHLVRMNKEKSQN